MDAKVLNDSGKITSITEKIGDLIKSASLESICSYSQNPDIRLSQLNDSYQIGQVISDHMGLILISGEVMKMDFKVHFNCQDVKPLTLQLYKSFSSETISDKQVKDFIKEFCNLTGGALRRMFAQNNVNLGMSLPLCTSGFHESTCHYEKSLSPPICSYDFWQLEDDFSHIICTTQFEILSYHSFESILNFNLEDIDDYHGLELL